MRKILLSILILFVPFFVMESIYAADTRVIVTERVPGAACNCTASCLPGDPVERRKYECTVTTGLIWFQNMFATIIRWIVNIVMLIWVLAIVGVGIAWSLAGGDDAKAKWEIKKWAMNILAGMIILFFFRYILQFLAPWIYR
jgi:hypothetical protein